MQRLKAFYLDNVRPKLLEEYKYRNMCKVPRILKVVINRGFDDSCQNSKILDSLSNEFKLLSGQKSSLRRSKNAISSFKIRKGMPIGMKVTLHGDKMYAFLDRLLNLVLPRIRDFQGLNNKSFDGCGNYSFSLYDQTIFPEVDSSKVMKLKGLDINIVTNSGNDQESLFFLKALGLPFK
uniref:Large ribosomal subunit protein uL5c n=1 Tax=Phacus orbicularis TaxID=158829 RepID=A0A182B0Y0_9EUGL|nr:ribosomal protein L5 [Phacus orbicularis]